MKGYLRATVLLLVAAGAALAVASAQGGPKPIPVLGFSPAGPYDFGSVAVGRSSFPEVFTLSVTGGKGTLGPFTTSVSPTTAGFSITADTCNGKRAGANKPCTITVRYSPTGVGSSTATLTASTSAGAYAASVSLSGTGFANSAPTATPDSVTVTPNTAKQITLSGTDPDGDMLTFAKTGGPTHGWLGTISGQECMMVIGGPGTCYADVTYTPDTGYTGSDSFTFTVDDGLATSAAATVSITVGTALPALSINDAPIAYYNTGTRIVTFTVSMDKTSGTDVTFDWLAADDTAFWGTTCDGSADYTSAAKTGTGRITAGTTTTTIAFGTCDPAPGYHYPWTPTYFTVTISNPTGATITTATGTGTIRTS